MKYFYNATTQHLYALEDDAGEEFTPDGAELISEVKFNQILADRSSPVPVDFPSLIASARYQHEIAGVAWGKYFIASDRESRNLLDQERSAVNAGLREENKGWKCLDTETGIVGFRPTTHDEILDIAATAYRYVAACFQRESDLLDLVEKGTFKEYLLEKGWPSSTP